MKNNIEKVDNSWHSDVRKTKFLIMLVSMWSEYIEIMDKLRDICQLRVLSKNSMSSNNRLFHNNDTP